MKISSSFNDSITPGMQRLIDLFPEIRRLALAKAGAALVNDAVREDPTPPIDTGNLRGSWSLIVEDKIMKQGNEPGSVSADAGAGRAIVGFNTPYAAYQHEGISKSGMPLQPGPKSERAGNTGPKFLEKKLNDRKDKYGEIMAEAVKDGLKKKTAGIIKAFGSIGE